MYATEFETIIKDSTIKIPDYENFKNKQVRVIILETECEHREPDSDDFISQLTANPRHIASDMAFLSRDEANER